MFWRRKEKVRKLFFIPEEHALEFVQKWQQYVDRPRGKDYVERYEFWKFVREVCPEAYNGKQGDLVEICWDDPSKPALARYE